MDELRIKKFGWVLRQVAGAGLLRGKTVGIDATTLEANAAMTIDVRRDAEESDLKSLEEAAGLEDTEEATLRPMDRRRKKKGSNRGVGAPEAGIRR
ncbi:MAG TPA: hypothetical protein VIX19_06495 [Terriglobales bacterium]